MSRLMAAQILEANLAREVQKMTVYTRTARTLKFIVQGCISIHNVVDDRNGDAKCGGDHGPDTLWPCDELVFISQECGVGVTLKRDIPKEG